MSHPYYQILYRDPCDVWRRGPAFAEEAEAERAAERLRAIHPRTEVRVERFWSADVREGFVSSD